MCDMTHSYVWHDSFVCVTWLIYTCGVTHSYVWHNSFTRVTWLIHVCNMTHSHVWHGSFICMTWLIHLCDMTHSRVWHDSFTHVTWLIHMCDMTDSYVWHDSFILVTWLISPYILEQSRLVQSKCANTYRAYCEADIYCWCNRNVPIYITQSRYILKSANPPAPMNHVKYLRAGPAEMPFRNWYTANTNHFRLTDSVRWKSKWQLGWVINIVPHNLVRRIRFGQ